MKTRRTRALLIALMTIAGFSCGSRDTSNYGGNNSSSTGSVPSELVGSWHLATATSPTCDPDTGVCEDTSARSETLTIKADGSFEHSLFAESNLSQCHLQAHHQSSGTATASGNTLSLHIRQGLTSVQDDCGNNGGDTNEAGRTYSYTYVIEGGQLTLTDQDGNDIGPFERSNT
jgi:hypothetical protein